MYYSNVAAIFVCVRHRGFSSTNMYAYMYQSQTKLSATIGHTEL